MPSSKVLHALATNPVAYMRFASTGSLPQTFKPDSPLIRLLDRISPRDRIRIVGLTVGPSLGYAGSRQFQSAEQALRWCRPDQEMLSSESFPADSWRMKGFRHEIHLDDLLACASSFPEGLQRAYPRLCNPRLGMHAGAEIDVDESDRPAAPTP